MGIVSRSQGGGGVSAILFDSTLGAPAASIDTGPNGIAQTSNVLDVYIYARTAEAVLASTLAITFNNDGGANYDHVRVTGSGAAASSNNFPASASLRPVVLGSTAPANAFGSVVMQIPNYTGTVGQKTGLYLANSPTQVGASMDVNAWGFGYRSTSAITRMAVAVLAGSNLATGTRVLLLGR